MAAHKSSFKLLIIMGIIPFYLFGTPILHWQISDDPYFDQITCEGFENFGDHFCLDPYTQGQLKSQTPYYFRIKDLEERDWPTPYPFYVSREEAYIRPSAVKEDVWETLTPYFLPEDHPIKAFLDDLFTHQRATLSLNSLKKAGFINPKPRKWTHLIVTKHKDLPGYIFKIYLDAQRLFKQKPEYEHWRERIQGSQLIASEIQKLNLETEFKVPKKWIYPLPEEPSPPKEFKRKNFILVEEDMEIYSKNENNAIWKGPYITRDKLEKLYVILETLGLHDCPKPDNVPISKDGRIAFVDTQSFFSWPVAYKKMLPYLSSEMKIEWKKITK